jgi:hypothetical protein
MLHVQFERLHHFGKAVLSIKRGILELRAKAIDLAAGLHVLSFKIHEKQVKTYEFNAVLQVIDEEIHDTETKFHEPHRISWFAKG